MFNSKEKKLQKEREAEEARINAEFDAKMTAKQERKKVEKTITEIDTSMQNLMQRAAEAKMKGYAEQYRNCVGMIKLARARKRQAEVFLFQMEAMQEMQAIAKNSESLLASMGSVMNSLGKLSMDKTVMMNSQRDFMSVQRELDRQTGSIEAFLSGMEMNLPDGDIGAQSDFSDESIDAEIEAIIGAKTGATGASGSGSSASSKDDDLEQMKKLLSM